MTERGEAARILHNTIRQRIEYLEMRGLKPKRIYMHPETYQRLCYSVGLYMRYVEAYLDGDKLKEKLYGVEIALSRGPKIGEIDISIEI